MSASAEHAFAVVDSVEAEGLRLKFDGEETAGEKLYKCNTFFKFSAGDRVYCVKDSGTFVAICKIGAPATQIVADYANVSYVPSAGRATNATYADNLNDYYSDGAVKIGYLSGVPQILRNGDTSSERPIWSVLDESTSQYSTGDRLIHFRSASDGSIEYQATYRSSTWYKLAKA